MGGRLLGADGPESPASDSFLPETKMTGVDQALVNLCEGTGTPNGESRFPQPILLNSQY